MDTTINTNNTYIFGLDITIWQVLGIIGSLIIPLIALAYIIKQYSESKNNLSIVSNYLAYWLIDRTSSTEPDRYWHSKYRLFVDFTFLNKSNQATGVYNVQVHSKKRYYNWTSKPGTKYTCTYDPMTETENGMTYSKVSEKTINIDLPISKQITDVFVLEPYSVKKGIMTFFFDEELSESLEILIHTTRGTNVVREKTPFLVRSKIDPYLLSQQEIELKTEFYKDNNTHQ